jgi:uncharacterized protein
LFHPVSLPADYVYKFDAPFKEMAVPFSQTDTISVVQFFPKDSVRRGVVLYFHGNRQNINRYAPFAKSFTRHGYEVWMEDYPGFGKSVGDRGEKNLYHQALQLYKMVQRNYAEDSIIVYGKSFGTGIAAYVAANSNCKRLLLETPYYSIPSLFNCYAPVYPTSSMSTYRIPTNEFLVDATMPVTILHGTNDWVIPMRCAAKLKPALKTGDEFIVIPGGTHHNLATFDLYNHKLDSLLSL